MWRAALLVLSACGRIGFDAEEIVCPSTYVETATGCYRLELDDPDELLWLAAEAACEAEGAHLAVIDDAAELAELTMLAGVVEDAWIGASDRVSSGTYLTVTRAPLFIGWGANEPDMTGDCVEMERGAIGDSNCDLKNDYVCEVDGRAVDPTTY